MFDNCLEKIQGNNLNSNGGVTLNCFPSLEMQGILIPKISIKQLLY